MELVVTKSINKYILESDLYSSWPSRRTVLIPRDAEILSVQIHGHYSGHWLQENISLWVLFDDAMREFVEERKFLITSGKEVSSQADEYLRYLATVQLKDPESLKVWHVFEVIKK